MSQVKIVNPTPIKRGVKLKNAIPGRIYRVLPGQTYVDSLILKPYNNIQTAEGDSLFGVTIGGGSADIGTLWCAKNDRDAETLVEEVDLEIAVTLVEQ